MHGNNKSFFKIKTFLNEIYGQNPLLYAYLAVLFSYSSEERREKQHLDVAPVQGAAAREVWRAGGFSGQKPNG